MNVDFARGAVQAAIQRASDATGVDFEIPDGRRQARKRLQSSPPRRRRRPPRGLFQFVDQTWLATLKQHGAKYGYASLRQDLIQQGADGRYHRQRSARCAACGDGP